VIRLRVILAFTALLSFASLGATWSKWNGVTVGSTTGNVGKYNNVTIGTTTGNLGAWNALTSPGGGGGTSVTVNLGQTIAATSNTDNNQLLLTASYFTTPTPSSGSISVTSMGLFVVSPTSNNWGFAIYTDNSGTPNALVSGCTSFSSSTPSTPVATQNFSGCTLSANTHYWAAFVTASASQQYLFSNGPCSASSNIGTNFGQTLGSFTSAASWPSSWTSSLASTNACYGIWATMQYTTTANYTVATGGTTDCTSFPCTVDIVTAGSGHGAFAGAEYNTGGGALSAVSDSQSDSFTIRGSCPISGVLGICGTSIDRITAGSNTLTFTFSSAPNYATVSYAELIGTAASSSFDQVHYDTSNSATPFTSGNTGTTGQANEILVGLVDNILGTGTFGAGGSWNLIGQATIASHQSGALYYQVVTNTGAYNLQGTYSQSGTENLPGLLTFK